MTFLEPIARAICKAKDGAVCKVRDCRGGLRCLFWRNHVPEAKAAVEAYEKAKRQAA